MDADIIFQSNSITESCSNNIKNQFLRPSIKIVHIKLFDEFLGAGKFAVVVQFECFFVQLTGVFCFFNFLQV